MRSTTVGQLLINQALPEDLRDYDRVWDGKTTAAVLRDVAEKHPEKYRDVSFRLLQIGRRAAHETGGMAFGLRHLRKTRAAVQTRERINQQLQGILADDNLTPKQRQEMITKIVRREMKPQQEAIFQEALASGNPLAMQILSGSRGSKMNLASLLGSDLLYADHHDQDIPIPVLRSYSEGLSPEEYLAGSYGARKGIIATKFATQDAGFFGKQLNQIAHRLVVTGEDYEDEKQQGIFRGVPVDTDDMDNEGALLAHPVGPYTKNTLLTPKILKHLSRLGHKRLLVRSAMTGGSADGGVYARDVGMTEKGLLPGRGEMVGLTAAQALSEPISQGQLSAKHSGGVSGEEKAVSGFDYINQLVQVPKRFKGGAAHSRIEGQVQRIEEAPAGGYYVTINNEKHYVGKGYDLKIKKGDSVEAGDVISEGIPNPAEITKYKGVGEGRRYFVHAMRQAMNEAGLKNHRRNLELLSRGLINHVRLTAEHGPHVAGDVVPYSTLEHTWEPRDGHAQLEPRAAVGQYLEAPVLHYTLGTQIRRSMLKDFDDFGVKTVLAHKDPPPFQPEMIRGMYSLQHDPDPVTRMYGSGLKKGLLNAVHRGAVSEERGTSFVPSLARSIDFGRDPNAAVRKPGPGFKPPTAPEPLEEPAQKAASLVEKVAMVKRGIQARAAGAAVRRGLTSVKDAGKSALNALPGRGGDLNFGKVLKKSLPALGVGAAVGGTYLANSAAQKWLGGGPSSGSGAGGAPGSTQGWGGDGSGVGGLAASNYQNEDMYRYNGQMGDSSMLQSPFAFNLLQQMESGMPGMGGIVGLGSLLGAGAFGTLTGGGNQPVYGAAGYNADGSYRAPGQPAQIPPGHSSLPSANDDGNVAPLPSGPPLPGVDDSTILPQTSDPQAGKVAPATAAPAPEPSLASNIVSTGIDMAKDEAIYRGGRALAEKGVCKAGAGLANRLGQNAAAVAIKGVQGVKSTPIIGFYVNAALEGVDAAGALPKLLGGKGIWDDEGRWTGLGWKDYKEFEKDVSADGTVLGMRDPTSGVLSAAGAEYNANQKPIRSIINVVGSVPEIATLGCTNAYKSYKQDQSRNAALVTEQQTAQQQMGQGKALDRGQFLDYVAHQRELQSKGLLKPEFTDNYNREQLKALHARNRALYQKAEQTQAGLSLQEQQEYEKNRQYLDRVDPSTEYHGGFGTMGPPPAGISRTYTQQFQDEDRREEARKREEAHKAMGTKLRSQGLNRDEFNAYIARQRRLQAEGKLRVTLPQHKGLVYNTVNEDLLRSWHQQNRDIERRLAAGEMLPRGAQIDYDEHRRALESNRSGGWVRPGQTYADYFDAQAAAEQEKGGSDRFMLGGFPCLQALVDLHGAGCQQ